jgi:hypothetical protein
MPLFGVEWTRWREKISFSARKGADLFVVASMVVVFTFLAFYGIEGKGSLRDKLSSISPVSLVPSYTQQVIDWIDSNTGSDDKIVVDRFRYDNDLIDFYSTRQGDNLRTKWYNYEEIPEYMNVNQPKYLVFSPEGRIRGVLELNPRDSVQSVLDMTFTRMLQTRHYIIYRISYDSALAG